MVNKEALKYDILHHSTSLFRARAWERDSISANSAYPKPLRRP